MTDAVEVSDGQLELDLVPTEKPYRRVVLEPDTPDEQVFLVGRVDTLIIRDDSGRVVVLVEPE